MERLRSSRPTQRYSHNNETAAKFAAEVSRRLNHPSMQQALLMTDVQVKIELGHKALPRTKPTAEGFTHDWTVYVRGPDQTNIANFVEKVVFHLHATYENPKRVCKEPPYHVSEHGYAGFEFPIDIYFKSKAEPKKLRFKYNLYLKQEDSVSHSRCEKFTFQNPTEEFRKKLLKAGGTNVKESATHGVPDSVQSTSNTQSNVISSSATKTKGNDVVTVLLENEKLKDQKLCKICMDCDLCVTFLPCSHRVTCAECSENLQECPLCRKQIQQKMKPTPSQSTNNEIVANFAEIHRSVERLFHRYKQQQMTSPFTSPPQQQQPITQPPQQQQPLIVQFSKSSIPDQEDEQYVTYKNNTNLPPEILRMDSRSRDLYLKALDEGKTKVHNIRVMVVGHFGVGKTTLTKRLLGEEVNISDRNSTEGIDVHVERCRVALETGSWEVKSKGLHNDDSSARLAKVVQQVCSTGLAISDTDSSLDVASCNYAGNLIAAPDGLDEPDSKHDESYSNSEGAGTSTNASLLSQIDTSVMDDIKLLVQRDNSEDLSNINNYADLSIWDFAGQYAFYGTHQTFLSPRSVYLLVIDLSKTIDSLICDDTCPKDTDGENRMKISGIEKLSAAETSENACMVERVKEMPEVFDFSKLINFIQFMKTVPQSGKLVEFWLQSIHFYTETEGMVILVGTHADKLAQEDRRENVNTFFNGLRSHLSDKPYCVCLSDYEFDIDNSKVDLNLKDLKIAIFNVAKSNKSHWGKLNPAKWLTLERQLHEMRQKAVKIIERDKLEEANRRLCVPLTGDELDLFLRFQHACGLLLYFSEQELKDYVILDPQWLIDAFKCFITADMFKQKNMKMLLLWNSFKGNAILTQEFIDLSWSKGGMFSDHKEHLLRLMEKLNIIAKPVTYGEHEITDLRVSRISEGSYFTPCMLKEKTPRSLLYTKQIPNSNSTDRLCYTFVSGQASGFVPPSIFHRLIAACMSTWQPRMTKEKNKTKYLLFCDSGVFDLDSSRIHTLTLYLRDNFIQMWVTSYSQNQPNDNIKARKQVECFLQKLYSNCSKMDMKTYIKCPRTDCCSSDGMIELSLLSDKLEYCCSMHDERSADQNHTILSADVLCDWTVVDRPKVLGRKMSSARRARKRRYTANTESVSVPAETTATIPVATGAGFTETLANRRETVSESVNLDIFLDRNPTDAEIATMAGRIGVEWQQVGRFLKLTKARMDQIEMDNPKSADRIYKMLMEWRNMFPHEGTFRTLRFALISADGDVNLIFEKFS